MKRRHTASSVWRSGNSTTAGQEAGLAEVVTGTLGSRRECASGTKTTLTVEVTSSSSSIPAPSSLRAPSAPQTGCYSLLELMTLVTLTLVIYGMEAEYADGTGALYSMPYRLVQESLVLFALRPPFAGAGLLQDSRLRLSKQPRSACFASLRTSILHVGRVPLAYSPSGALLGWAPSCGRALLHRLSLGL